MARILDRQPLPPGSFLLSILPKQDPVSAILKELLFNAVLSKGVTPSHKDYVESL